MKSCRISSYGRMKKIYVRKLTRKKSARTETDSPNVRNMISLNRKKALYFT